MTSIIMRRMKLHDGQKRIMASPARYRVASCGRRFGKTMLAAYWLAMRDSGSAINRRRVAWFAPTYKIMLEAWGDIEHSLKPVIKRATKTEQRITLTTGGVIDFWTLHDSDAGRSRRYHRVVIDEAAHAPNLESIWTKSISQTLTDYQGEALFISSPRGSNYFKALFERGDSVDWPEWASFRMPTASNPFIPPGEIALQQRQLPARVFAQEYLAEFVADGVGVFRRVDKIPRCAPLDQGRPGLGYVIGADWGRTGDFTAFCVVELGTNRAVALDRFTDVSYPVQSGRLKALSVRFNNAGVVAEANSMGLPIIEQLQRDGLAIEPFWTSNASKAQAIESLALALEQGELELIDNPDLIGELVAYDSERLPSGGVRYSAPPGKHDDCVMALAMAWHGARQAASAPIAMRRK